MPDGSRTDIGYRKLVDVAHNQVLAQERQRPIRHVDRDQNKQRNYSDWYENLQAIKTEKHPITIAIDCEDLDEFSVDANPFLCEACKPPHLKRKVPPDNTNGLHVQ